METNGYRLLLPEGTLDYFNISDVKESSSEIVIYLEEKNELPGEYSTVKVESKGFYDSMLDGKKAVKEKLIDQLGGISDALDWLYREIERAE